MLALAGGVRDGTAIAHEAGNQTTQLFRTISLGCMLHRRCEAYRALREVVK